ncbi:glycoside hydrolase family 6 protein [Frankia canadensis]
MSRPTSRWTAGWAPRRTSARARGGRAGTALAGVLAAALLAGCGLGGSRDAGGGQRDAGGQGATGTSTKALPAPDPTRCPAGAGQSGGGQDAGGAPGPGRDRAPRGPFLVDPRSQAAQVAAANPATAQAIAPLVQTPTAFPVGDWLTDVTGEVRSRTAAATASGSTAVFMIYAIPHRDVAAGFSAGGLPDAGAYRQFTRQVAAGIGAARAVLVLEPDALGQIDELAPGQAAERYVLLRDAVDVYASLPATSVYLDGANCGWIAPGEMARRLAQAGVAHARGFAVNVANYYRTGDEVSRAEIVAGLLGGAHYVVDTSRNGRGPASGLANAWCNPPGRGLGIRPTTETGYPHADAFLWVKTPGASDGECGRGDPSAGTWWQRAATDLVRNASE